MSFCQVIKGNDRPCRNYARKGFMCCYAHRKLETEPCVVIEPEQNVQVSSPPPKVEINKVNTLEITPWDDDDLWEQIIEVAHKGPEEFVDGLHWVAVCCGVYTGPVTFVFHKSLAKTHVDQIIKNQGSFYAADLLFGNVLTVYMTIM